MQSYFEGKRAARVEYSIHPSKGGGSPEAQGKGIEDHADTTQSHSQPTPARSKGKSLLNESARCDRDEDEIESTCPRQVLPDLPMRGLAER
jgi:hypothetical protein